MYIGNWLLVRYKNEVKKGFVIEIHENDLTIKLDDNTIIKRKFWEVRKYDEDGEEVKK